MASKLNTEFNYRYQVIGDTAWEKIKTLKGFLEGRVRAAALEEVGNLKNQAKVSKLKHLQNGGHGLEHEILELKAEILEAKSHQATEKEAFELNRKEITQAVHITEVPNQTFLDAVMEENHNIHSLARRFVGLAKARKAMRA